MKLSSAVRHCEQFPTHCMRPVSLSRTGSGVAWYVRRGDVIRVDDEDAPALPRTVLALLGEWETLTIAALEREERERITGV